MLGPIEDKIKYEEVGYCIKPHFLPKAHLEGLISRMEKLRQYPPVHISGSVNEYYLVKDRSDLERAPSRQAFLVIS